MDRQTPCQPYRITTVTVTLMALIGLVQTSHARQAAGEQIDALNAFHTALVRNALGLTGGEVVTLAVDAQPGEAITLAVPIGGNERVIDLSHHSVRAPGYQLLVDVDGVIAPAIPGPVRTLRGTVRDLPAARVAGSLMDRGLHLAIHLDDETRVYVEPVSHLLPQTEDHYVVYQNDDVLPSGGSCGFAGAVELEGLNESDGDAAGGGGIAGGGPCIAQLACDADTEYSSTWGASTEARINAVINGVNLQYEQQVGITHQITTIIVRTGTDPYTTIDASGRLCQFITEWTNNQTGIQRDLAQLFTGVDLGGTTIGIAADIGGSGVCVPQGACSGGPFGPLGSYCLSQSDFDPNFGCSTDLSAHEMGHLWGAFHCSCPNNTMNSGITCTNSFGAGSITSINNYRNTRSCLTGSCSSGPVPPANDDCASATVLPCNATEYVNTSSATPASGGGGDPQLPAGSPSCQWQGTPTNVHNTVWYEFTAGDTSVEISTCGTVGIADTTIALYSGSCGSLTELACSEDVCGASTYMSSICYDGLTPGNTYLFVVGHPGGWAESTPGGVLLDLTCPCPSIGPVAGACCLPGGSCIDLQTPASCSAMSGTFQGAGTDCAGSSCGPATEACCFGDGTCQDLTTTDCSAQNGTSQGPGTSCASANCPQPTEACCFGDGSCQDLTTTDCSGQGGTSQGPGTNCGTTNCPQPTEACCFSDDSCLDLTVALCNTQGGTPQGPGTDCAGTTCGGGGDIVNLATADFATAFGSITAGSFVDTHVQDDVYEQLTEEQTNGNPSKRKSRLEHTWTFNVAAGSSYTFFVDAFHDDLDMDEDLGFDFSYSLDNASYSLMLTVSKTSDDDSLQSFAFPVSVAGTVYIRVEDDDRTNGNSDVDSIFVDEMFILTSTQADTTPPESPTNLGATAGNGQVTLDWDDNVEPDLSSYNVYRSTSMGGPYSFVDSSGVSTYIDGGLTNGTTYYYVVTAVDIAGNESADSNEANATPQGGVATTMHVDSIVVTTVNQGGGNKSGRAVVTVRDNTGALVSGVVVTGEFTGDITQANLTGTTGANGQATINSTDTAKGGVNITFCVTSITGGGLTYNPNDNVETCDTN